IPSHVIRMAPKPRRWTVSSPPSEIVPLEPADKVFIFTVFSFMFILQRTPVLMLARSDRCHPLRTSSSRDRISSRLSRQPDQGCDQDRSIELSDERFCRRQRSSNAMHWMNVTITHAGERGEAEVNQTARFTCRNSCER